MPEVTYTALTVSDVNLFKDLLRVFGEAFEDIPTYQDKMPTDEHLKHFLDREDTAVVIAMQQGQVVGGLAAYVLTKFEQDRKEVYIYDLAVSENHRRQGIATGLINRLKEVAREKGAYIIFVQADKGDEPAIKLYESLGKGEETLNFDIELGN
jgi:aminoglycoside 3-N-acetyltransferase I